jgi:hypothetical protein
MRAALIGLGLALAASSACNHTRATALPDGEVLTFDPEGCLP